MNDQALLQMIMAISLYCTVEAENSMWAPRRCFRQVWQCAHTTKDVDKIPTLVHNCISKRVEK